MGVLSKVGLTLPYTCHQLGHTWTSSCFDAAAGVGWSSFREGMKLNAPFYLVIFKLF